ncbi:hypothetical protein J5N58_18350 [Rhizobium cremeum]|uniref:hypothetical protein n=1 Tax=Rhizobium cremeum TaxID=2813827 RepID=UPI000DD758F0|nr:hypothetical protein [Rhizobium cremeum]MCJ7996386.1 hypothetical protein [Rhizobium cremeum]MCJ8001645.1 hypothetical protein [Rhizobium cremeum]
MLKRFLPVLGLLLLAGCQSSAPQSVADSQVPPSPALRRAVIKAFEAGAFNARNIYDPKISSVVLLDPPTKTYAFCLRGSSQRGIEIPTILGVSFRDGRILGASKTDFRCRDKRLRYYPFPELYAFNSQG